MSKSKFCHTLLNVNNKHYIIYPDDVAAPPGGEVGGSGQTARPGEEAAGSVDLEAQACQHNIARFLLDQRHGNPAFHALVRGPGDGSLGWGVGWFS